MKKIGIIENMSYSPDFFTTGYEGATAQEVMTATGGNTGNCAFVYAVRKILGHSVTRIDWGTPEETVNESLDHIVICCANQLGEHVDLAGWADRIKRFEKPVTLIGLGAQSPDLTTFPDLPEGTLRFLHAVDERRKSHSPNIAVRGSYTKKLLEKFGIPSVAAGCPSLHISPIRNLGASILKRQTAAEVKRLAVAAGNPWHAPSAMLENTLVEAVEAWNGEYVIQHPLSMLQYAFHEDSEISERARARFLEVYGRKFDHNALLQWFRRYSSVFVDAPNWIRFLRKFDLVIGPRYHGVALGIQAGIPGSVICIDSRTTELCEGTGIPTIALVDALSMTPDELVQASLWSSEISASFDATRTRQGKTYMDFLASQSLEPSQHLSSLV